MKALELHVPSKHLENVILKYNTCKCCVYLFFFFHKGLHTGKKKPSKTTVIDSSVCEIEPLQLETKRSSRLQTKVKRRLMMNESEENDELAPLTNIQNAIHIKVDESSDSNNDEVDLFKRTTRQKNL